MVNLALSVEAQGLYSQAVLGVSSDLTLLFVGQ